MTFFERINRIDRQVVWRTIDQTFMAYWMASYAAGIVIYLYMLVDVRSVDVANILITGALFAVPIAILSLIPAILAVVVLRKTRLRRGFAEIGVGALIGFFISLAFFIAFGDDAIPTWTFLIRAAAFGLAGAVAGLTYWLVLGCPKSLNAR